MDDSYKKWIGEIFDRAASEYGQKNSNYFDYFAKGLVDISHIKPGCSVLDVATGRGAILKRIIKAAGPKSTIIGIDLSSNMIEHTSKEVQNKNVQLLVMDAENLSFENDTFDYLFCGFGLFFFPHLERALQEFFRVLKPGGKLFFSTWQGRSECQQLYNKELMKYGLNSKLSLHHFDQEDFIRTEMARAGFIKIKIIPDELEHVHPSIEDWFRSLWTHASRGNLERLSEREITELKENLHISLRPFVKQDGLHELIRAFYTEATKPS